MSETVEEEVKVEDDFLDIPDYSYLSNPRLKKAGIEIALTPDQVKEYQKCARRPQYFINKYLMQITQDEGLSHIKLWPFQKKIIKTFHENRFSIAKLPRQTGKTTMAVGYMLWFLLFNEFKTVGVLAQKEVTSIEILSRLKIAFECVPLWMQQGIVAWNAKSIQIENGSRIFAGATSGGAIRGFTLSLLFLDEFAHVQPNIAEQFFTSVYPTITSGKTTKIIIASTPNGLNLYWRFWKEAEEKRNQFVPISARWSEVPGRTQKWADDQLSMLKERMYTQEVECEFLGSAGTLIKGSVLRTLTWTEGEKMQSLENMMIWEKPQEKRLYAMTVDTAEGTQLDYSCLNVFDVTEMPYKQVARYRDNSISTLLLPQIIVSTAMWYNNAYVLIENNNLGGEVCHNVVYELEYDNVFWSMANDSLGPTATQQTASKKIGLRTTTKTKMIGCSALKTLVEAQQLILNDADTISELSVFVLQPNGSYKAEMGYNDDLSMTLVLFAWLTKQPLFKDISDHDLRKKLLEGKIREIEMDMPLAPIEVKSNNPKHELPGSLIKERGIIWEVVGKWGEIDPQGVEPETTYAEFFNSFYGRDS